MKASIKTQGFSGLYASLRHAGQRVQENGRKTMHRQADAIVKEARLNAPVDKHNLEESIRKEIDYVQRGRLQITIKMGGFVGGVNVDRYALEVHENYESMKPGPGTLAKMQANPGRIIGSKFLERAIEASRGKLQKAMVEAVIKEWHL